ncbi:SPOR domain-containing protein [Alteromonas sp. a30]|uniref:SPOR domain-containing protein n=1 Tax=Alteromonas sp. a30 TaxID=2730917 RepID=UPI0022801316|nr:SPOR domain-containing protein [Alteromonas sp. a30]MCY7295246.1 SPOR domain-containing protein [Alteromonas sp. a30]
MASAFQNRLVGTIILVALAVIFLPEVLDGEKQRSQDHFENFPKPPAMRTLSPAESFPIQEVEEAVARKVEIVDEKPVDEFGVIPKDDGSDEMEVLADASEVGSEDVSDAGWIIQLGSFRHQKNVRELQNKLEQAGYRTFTRPIQTSSGLLTKVFVGPDLEKDNLQKALPHLRELTGLKGKLTPFTVN